MLNIKMSTKWGPVFTFNFPGVRLPPLPPPVSYATGYDGTYHRTWLTSVGKKFTPRVRARTSALIDGFLDVVLK